MKFILSKSVWLIIDKAITYFQILYTTIFIFNFNLYINLFINYTILKDIKIILNYQHILIVEVRDSIAVIIDA